MSGLGQFLIPGLIIFLVLGMIFVAFAVASRYIKVPPNAIAVFYGRKYKYTDSNGKEQHRGFHILTGGGKIVLPVVEKYQIMSTAAFQIEVSEDRIPTAKNVRVNVSGVATCKISDKQELMSAAVQSFLGKNEEEIRQFVQQILNGHLRSIVGKLEIDQLLRKRDDFNRMVIEESTTELARLGFDLVSIVIKDINDTEGFIDALGKQAVAEVKRDAEIKVAEATRDTEIKVAEATRDTEIKVAEAKRTAAEVTAQNQAKTAEAQKELAVKQAGYKKETETTRAQAEKAFAIADAEQAQKLVMAEASRDSARAEAQAGVQDKEAVLNQKRLQATVIVEAEAKRQAAIIEADGKKQAAVINAEAAKDVAARVADELKLKAEGEGAASIKRAEGESRATILRGEGEASQTRAIALATAEGNKAKLLADADGEKAKLLALAEGERAKLLATAEGQLKMALALKELSEQGKLIIVLDKLPAILAATGDAGAKIAGEIFKPLGEGLGSIDNVTILDNGTGANGVGKFGGTIPGLIANIITQAKASGLDLSGLCGKFGIDAKGLMAITGPGLVPSSATPATPIAAAEQPAPATAAE